MGLSLLRAFLFIAPSLMPMAAAAQVGASMTVQSDFRYRGRSISDRKPGVGLNLSYDHGSGAYLGATAAAAPTQDDGIQILRYVTYAGYVVAPKVGPAFDFGVSNYRINDFSGRKRTFIYNEIYSGLATDHLSFRLNYAPDYYGSGIRTLYADLAATARPASNLRAFAHAGVLAPVGGRAGPTARRRRYDFSIGLARQFGRSELSLSWISVSPRVVYADGEKEARDSVVVTASYFF